MSSGKKYSVLAPLSGFSWKGELTECNAFTLKHIRYHDLSDLHGFESELSGAEQEEIRSVTHWLTFGYEENSNFNQPNIIILFLIGLWLSVPTMTHVKWIFKSSAEAGDGRERSLIRCLEHFQWIKEQISKDISTEQIKEAFENIQLIMPMILREEVCGTLTKELEKKDSSREKFFQDLEERYLQPKGRR